MDFIKKTAQILWNVTVRIIRGVVNIFQWWAGKIKTSGSTAGSLAWLTGGLLTACCMFAFLFSLTPASREGVAQGQATGTAVAVLAVTSEYAAQNIPTIEPSPTNTAEPTNTMQPTNTAEPTSTAEPTDAPTPTAEVTPTPIAPTLTPTGVNEHSESVEVSKLPMATIAGVSANIRSGPGTDYPIVDVFQQGEVALATGFNSSGNWVQIKLPSGGFGWVASDLVEIDNSEDIETVANIPPPPAPTGSSEQPSPSSDSSASGSDAGGSSGGNSENPFQCVGGCISPPDPSCVIKGNVNSSGEKIYHVPGGEFYDRTNIKPDEGDRWFCSRAEAKAAGFRPSSR